MGEVVVSSEEVVEVSEAEEDMLAHDGGGDRPRLRRRRRKKETEGLVKWERFLPKIALKVLLVEADDSTRQIIGALLRKCSYRVVAAPDGLKAWEMLKGKPGNVDLILTEVDLPSISGYALLTLIMEHEICKNIPVIMMSSQDSVSTVYKCMLRGAADYLVKPLRRNELRNLWQHVWRRQRLLAAENMALDESVGQQKLEAISENNSASNHGNEIQRNNETLNRKGSDAQSSCMRPDLEAESADMENNNNLKDLLQSENGKSLPENETQMMLGPQNVANANDACHDTGVTDVPGICPQQAIDFMGASVRGHECGRNDGAAKFGSLLELGLSLRRSHPINGSGHKSSCDRPALRPSNASAFTRYVNRPLQTQCSISPGVSDQRKGSGTNQDEKNSSNAAIYNYNHNPSNESEPPPSIASRDQSAVYVKALSSEPPPGDPRREHTGHLTHQSSYPVPVPVKGIRFNNSNVTYPSMMPPIFVTQSSPSPTPSPSSVSPQEYSSQFHPFHPSGVENGKLEYSQERDGHNNHSTSPNPQVYQPDCLDERRYISSVTEHVVIGGVCNVMHYENGSVTNSNPDQQATTAEKKSEDGFSMPNGKTQRSLQREAALTKFRMKRKDRCFEKKVRYESRKKLAEQRPRVKGQFVRQVPVAEPTTSAQALIPATQENPQ